MTNSFWVGVWPGLTDKHLDYMVETLKKAVGTFEGENMKAVIWQVDLALV